MSKKTVVDWNNYSKSTVAIAMNQSVCEEQFPPKWHEFLVIPSPNNVGFGFWTTLGHTLEQHSELFIRKEFVPNFSGSWKNSLFVRPEIEEAIRLKFKTKLAPRFWKEEWIYDINFWLKYDYFKE